LKQKKSHIGMAGHLAVMSELIHLGYNAVLPAVDVGEDLFVIDDQEGEILYRVQVKTASQVQNRKKDGATLADYQIPKDQLRDAKRVELYYVFARRLSQGYDFVIVSREALEEIRRRFEKSQPKRKTPTKRGTSSPMNVGKTHKLTLAFTDGDVSGWEQSFQEYRNNFTRYFKKVTAS
jgi:hypothetical protein